MVAHNWLFVVGSILFVNGVSYGDPPPPLLHRIEQPGLYDAQTNQNSQQSEASKPSNEPLLADRKSLAKPSRPVSGKHGDQARNSPTPAEQPQQKTQEASPPSGEMLEYDGKVYLGDEARGFEKGFEAGLNHNYEVSKVAAMKPVPCDDRVIPCSNPVNPDDGKAPPAKKWKVQVLTLTTFPRTRPYHTINQDCEIQVKVCKEGPPCAGQNACCTECGKPGHEVEQKQVVKIPRLVQSREEKKFDVAGYQITTVDLD